MNDCWICGDLANSKEHKFKASDIKRIHGKKFNALFVHENATQISSYKDRILKFPEIICEECNVKRTRPHDDAYDIFINYCIENYESLLASKELDFEIIFGKTWIENKRNLYRYFAKHAGCKIVTCKTAKEYPQDLTTLSNFILGTSESPNFVVKFELKQVIKFLTDFKKKVENEKYGHLFIMPIFPFGYTNNLNFGGWISNHWITTNWVFGNNISRQKTTKFDRKIESLEIIGFEFYDFENLDRFVDVVKYSDIGNLNTTEKKLEHYQRMIT